VTAKPTNLKPLTAKQTAFVQHFIAHNSVIEAYRACYKTSGKQGPDHANANKTYNNPNVRAAIEAAKIETHNAAIMTRARALELLTKIATSSPDGIIVTTRDNISALDKLAKLEGWESAQKVELSGIAFNLNLSGDSK